MSNIPLDLERKCEQRWAARFARPAPAVPPQEPPLKKQRQQLAAPDPETDAAFYAGVTSAGTWRKDEFDDRVSSGRRGFG
jgi:hypothetical protein